MRISDWSSDVCSSDLAAAAGVRDRRHHEPGHTPVPGELRPPVPGEAGGPGRPAPAGRPARRAGSPGGGAMSDRVHVVVVDDERDIRETVAEYLELNGYKVSKAEGGAALRRIVAQGRVSSDEPRVGTRWIRTCKSRW